jgi:hypothetical protein
MGAPHTISYFHNYVAIADLLVVELLSAIARAQPAADDDRA